MPNDIATASRTTGSAVAAPKAAGRNIPLSAVRDSGISMPKKRNALAGQNVRAKINPNIKEPNLSDFIFSDKRRKKTRVVLFCV